MNRYLKYLVRFDKIVNNTDNPQGNNAKLIGCFASYHYYDTIKEQVSSIFRSIILNHALIDGNKRVAFMFILVSSKELNLNITLSDNEICDLIVNDIIKNKLDVKEISKKLFREH